MKKPTQEIYKIFLALFLLCHVIAHIAVNSDQPSDTVALVAYLLACLLWRGFYYGSRFLFNDSERVPQKWQRKVYFLFGLTSHDEEAERLETQDVQELTARHRVLGALPWVVFSSAMTWFLTKHGQLPREMLFLYATGFVLSHGSHLRHLFLALLLSTPPVLIQAWTRELEKPWLVAYSTCLFFAFMVYRFLETSAQTGKAMSLERLPVARTFGVLGLFLSLLVAFDFILPQPAPPRSLPPPLSEKLARHIADTLVDRELRHETSNGGVGQPRTADESPSPGQGASEGANSNTSRTEHGTQAQASASPHPLGEIPTAQPAATPVANPEKKKAELSKELAVWIRFAAQMTKIALVVTMILLGFLFFARTRKKPDETRVRKIHLSREARNRLREILAGIKTRRLSASEEIIETYNALLMIFAESHFPRAEDTPVSLFADSVRLALPPLGPPMNSATECFERTLYGEKKATSERLQAFRESSRAIVRFFNI